MTRIRSYSLSDADPRNRVVDSGIKKYGGHTDFVRALLDLYAAAISRHGTGPLAEKFDAAYLEAEVASKRQLAAVARQEAEQAQVALDIIREQEAQLDAPNVETPEALLDTVWANLPPPGPGRTEALRELARRHGFEAAVVLKAAGKRWSNASQRQTDLRVLPRRRAQPPQERGPQ